MPRQSPKNGILFSLAYFIAASFPSMPRFPKPPGTIIPETSANISSAFSFVIVSESTHLILTVVWLGYPACFKDSTTLI